MRKPQKHKCRCPCLLHRDEIHPGKASECAFCLPIMRKRIDAYTRIHQLFSRAWSDGKSLDEVLSSLDIEEIAVALLNQFGTRGIETLLDAINEETKRRMT